MKETYNVIGLMSGTSLDGVDIAYCQFNVDNGNWSFKIKAAKTYSYSDMWLARLHELPNQSIEILPKTNAYYGRYLGGLVRQFCQEFKLEPDFVASHGHTIFHDPTGGFTTQIGDGAALSAYSNLPVVCDFRSMDVALGGQGAPLVPIGDQLLFPEFDSCLNLGGFSNISYTKNGKIIAFDISPCNILLNEVAQQLGKPFDEDGKMAASGEVNNNLVEDLNQLEYYQKMGAKSLGREWVKTTIYPVLQGYSQINELDLLASLCTHFGQQIGKNTELAHLKQVLVTGGGVYNAFLMKQIQENTQAKLVIPQTELVQFKEALIFAFLGVLRLRNQMNVLSSVTGSKRDHVAGALYGDFSELI
ncbi:MAG: anhydro-N-acetylmuramic acid kinase [Bacteroidetes bacterium B1(2017)]|nr:MAG: anhydro-N-acetylmuramic acid kinase [Bacteroidetes bacterium B1(2017)]